MSRARRAARLVAAATAVAVTTVLAGCATMPESGPVVETRASGSGGQDDAVDINPRLPGKGDTAEDIVRGFLEAMQATPPITTAVAREFLSREARASWSPTQTITYAAASAPRGNNAVSVTLSGADRTDGRGAWLGSLTETESTLTFPMASEGGEWRIAEAPDALIVPQSWFEQRFRQVSLYFFDPTGTVLVPDPVFVPRGSQFASSLVNGLLTGPAPALAAHQLSFLPAHLRAVVSVPVSEAGVADVELTSDTAEEPMPTAEEAELLVSQLAWTLRQDPAIERFRVTIDGRAVQLIDGASEFDVEHGHEFAPYVAGSSTQLFGLLLDGRMVGGSAQNLEPVTGSFGQSDYGLRAVAADVRADRVAGVTDDGTTLLVGTVKEGGEPVTEVITTGEDLLDPAWDFSGRVWAVDRRREGSVVQYLQDDRVRTLEVPGISGENVKRFLVSRDGSRLVAVLRRAGSDVIVVSRILTTGDGRVVEALPAVDLTGTDPGRPVRDIAWRSPTSVVVLLPVGRNLFQVRTLTVDGSPSGRDALSMTIDGTFLGLAGTPVLDETTYAFAKGVLRELAGPRAESVEIDPRVTTLGYAG